MSRMTKFLKQTCTFERAISQGNGLATDKFGAVLYEPPIRLKCRRERIVKDVQTSTGAILRSSTRYFLDNSQPIVADDKLDGKAVLIVEEYIGSRGLSEGYECYV